MKPDLTAAELVEKLDGIGALVQLIKEDRDDLRAYWLAEAGKLASENLPTILAALRAQTAGEDERARIVAWLRREVDKSEHPADLADAIERGDHARAIDPAAVVREES